MGRERLRSVALVGIDGSGKTTQAHRVAAALTAVGVPASYRQNAGGRRWLGRLANRLGRPDALSLVGPIGLLLVETVLRGLAITRTVLWSRWSGRVAVMDRHAVCQYASIRAHNGGRGEWLARYAYGLFPQPQVTFLLLTDPVDAYWRVRRRGTDRETLDYLRSVDAAYRSLPEHSRFVLIEASRPPEEVTRQIMAHLVPCPAGLPATTFRVDQLAAVAAQVLAVGIGW